MKLILRTFLCILISCQAFAAIEIDITQGKKDPVPIAIHAFGGAGSQSHELGKKISQVIANDLENSGSFRPLDEESFIEKIPDSNVTPTFASWRQINAQLLLVGDVRSRLGSGFRVEFALWDIFGQKQLIKASLESNSDDQWRRVAHRIADEFYKRVTGIDGYFNSKVAFIATSGAWKNPVKRLAIVDQDGENLKYLTNGKHMVLMPRFSPDNRYVLYMTYAHKVPKVHMLDLKTKSDRLVGHFPGMSYAPQFSSDENFVVLSASLGGRSDIFEVNLANMEKKQLTNGPFIDTSPSYSPDGSKICFSSDRGGLNQLYVMNRDGGNQTRISFGRGSYNSPVWSPKGDYIAFVKMASKQFFIGIMRPDGSEERVIASGFLVESIAWGPNGRVVVFTRGEPGTKAGPGKSSIHTIDVSGFNEREIVVPHNASYPSWSKALD